MTRTATILRELRRFESRNITHVERDGSWPIVWERARGTQVWDVEGKAYLDLTAAFGVAAAGHANPRVVRAGQRQMSRLLHAMGDVHPHRLKGQLARELSRMVFPRGHGKVIFCNSGFEAVEAALKTALLATGRPGVIAFSGGYHGLGYGALNTTHRTFFRGPFQSQLAAFGRFVPFPQAAADLTKVEKELNRHARRGGIGAILVEPVQARGGIRVPPAGFLPLLRRWSARHGVLLILDEIYTGFGRTGVWLACEHSGVTPDLVCLGKALTGGFPLSACVGRAELMDGAWPDSTGEALHTSTYLGHPVGCAMALAQIAEIRRRGLVERGARLGRTFMDELRQATRGLGAGAEVRGLGLMVGLELRGSDGAPATALAIRVVKGLLARGIVVLPEGEHGNVIGFTPPLTVTAAELRGAARDVGAVLAQEVKRGNRGCGGGNRR